jgi:hypothetical protein
MLDFRALSDVFDQLAQRDQVEMPAKLVEKDWRIGIIGVFPVNQVAPYRFARRLAQVHCTPFAAFRPADHAVLHFHPSPFLVGIGQDTVD